MSLFSKAAKAAATLGLRTRAAQGMELFQQQTRKMGGDGPSAFRSLDGRPPPPEWSGPDFVTYAGYTIKKRPVDKDRYASYLVGSVFWFTWLYHGYLNWDEHWNGDIWVFEKDVQVNGWDDEGHGHGHAHGHH